MKVNAATDRTSTAQKPSYQHFIQVLLCIIVVIASYMSTDGHLSTTEAKSYLPDENRSALDRGKHIGNYFNSREFYNAYKEVESIYHDAAFAESSQNLWKILADNDGVEVALMEHPSDPSCPYVRMKAEIDVPVDDCWNFLALENWPKTMPKMDPFYQGVELHGEYSYGNVNMILARKRTNRILAFEKRDFVFLSVSDEPRKDGTLVSGTVSIQTPKIPRVKGYIRAFQDSIAFYKPLSTEKTQITIVCRIDLNDSDTTYGAGGNIPMWLYVKTIGISGMKSVVAMRNALLQERAEKEQHVHLNESNDRDPRVMNLFRMPWRRKKAPRSNKVRE